MTNQSKRILKILNKASGPKKLSLCVDFDNMVVLNEEDESLSLKVSENEIIGLFKSLVTDNYIYFEIPSTFPCGDFYLTQKGLYWREIRNKAILSFVITSILMPIAVSILTTIIVTKIGATFPVPGSP